MRLERVTIAEWQGASEGEKFVAKPTQLNMSLFSTIGSLIALLVNTFFFLSSFLLGLDKSEGSPWFSSGSFSWRSLLLILLSHYIVRSKRLDNVLHGF